MTSTPSCPIVLVADDSVGHRRMVELVLSAHNYDVVSTGDGHEALTYLQSNTPHLAILDVDMPFMTGIQVCARVRRIARLRSLPLIIMTSLASDATRAAAHEAGADLVVAKPLAGKSIAELMKEASAAARVRCAAAIQPSGDSTSSSSLL